MLENVLQKNLNIVFCGTAASSESARRQLYYAGPGNRFWLTLHECGLTAELLQPKNYLTLPKYKIGLTDVVKNQSGMDSEINFKQANVEALRNNIENFQPKLLCFNGKKAAQIALRKRKLDYGLQDEMFGTTQLVVLPSTSGAARKFWNIDYWQHIPVLLNQHASESVR